MELELQIHPANPIAAVTHPNPYPYYAHLVAEEPLYYDESLKLWVASSAQAVTDVLTSDLCRVRPPAEPIPKLIAGSAAGDIFGRLVRMNDSAEHYTVKRAVRASLGTLDAVQAAQAAHKWADFLLDTVRPDLYPARLSDFAFQLPIYVVASMLGVPEKRLSEVAGWTKAFVESIAPRAEREAIERGNEAAQNLLDLFHSMLAAQQIRSSDRLLVTLAREATAVGSDDADLVVANAIGLLSQTYEATAGLIGNTLKALASFNDLYDSVSAYPELLNPVIQEVLRFDPPVQNTRRFVARSGVIAGQPMNEGDVILVLLAAANRDPSVNERPDQFDIFRHDRKIFTFGIGQHACPGDHLATTIATAGVEQLILSALDLNQIGALETFRPSVNVRVPLFGEL